MSDTIDLGELQSILVGASRCLDCRDPRCLSICPEHVDVRAAMRLILTRAPGGRFASWMQQADEVAAGAADAIQASFDAVD